MDDELEILFFIVVAALAAYFIYRMAQHGGFKAAIEEPIVINQEIALRYLNGFTTFSA